MGRASNMLEEDTHLTDLGSDKKIKLKYRI
jgi:hypothetical protein